MKIHTVENVIFERKAACSTFDEGLKRKENKFSSGNRLATSYVKFSDGNSPANIRHFEQ